MIKILYFGRLADLTQCREEHVQLPDSINTVETLKKWLSTRHDLGKSLTEPTIKTMINQKLVHSSESIKHANEIGFLPPVGGG